jgi:hypothetical protein
MRWTYRNLEAIRVYLTVSVFAVVGILYVLTHIGCVRE